MADELTVWSLAAETLEWVGPIDVTADDVPVTTFTVNVALSTARPGTFTATTTLDGGRGVLVGVGSGYPLIAGKKYTVWIKFTDSPEVPVMRVGTIRVT